ncbi:MAG: RNA methyltransferase [Acidobacteriota bacterium]|nr:RNA methyltransferase [Acidobacteriota bacterium]
MQITSNRNPVMQGIRRAAATGRTTEDGCIVAEGPHLLEEALQGAWRIERIIATSEACDRHSRLLQNTGATVTEVSERAFAAAAATETTQGVIALLRPRQYEWRDLMCHPTLLLVLDGVQDPGNAGTIVRSAEAFGATGIVFLTGCVRVANGKFLRATAGSILRMPYIETASVADLNRFVASGRIPLYALTARGDLRITSADLKNACAIAVGSEGTGISNELLRSAIPVSIPAPKVESLNAAVACSIALFEAARQRSHR